MKFPFRSRGQQVDDLLLKTVLLPPDPPEVIFFTHHDDRLADLMKALLSRPEQWSVRRKILPESGRAGYLVTVNGSVMTDQYHADAVTDVGSGKYPPKANQTDPVQEKV